MRIAMRHKGLFEDYKYCEICRRPLALDYEGTLCQLCEEQALFMRVKEFIRENDVTEYDVVEEFHIPLSRVKHWIREGRIEYKDKELNKRISYNCQGCGAQISFGTLCAKCLKQSNMEVHAAAMLTSNAQTRMRFLDNVDGDQ